MSDPPKEAMESRENTAITSVGSTGGVGESTQLTNCVLSRKQNRVMERQQHFTLNSLILVGEVAL